MIEHRKIQKFTQKHKVTWECTRKSNSKLYINLTFMTCPIDKTNSRLKEENENNNNKIKSL
uniref:Uncharacterized protein n=1 Tax=Rhizophora mucronata TaxID=61149 RepID=A0A2P2NI19_RHIMU